MTRRARALSSRIYPWTTIDPERRGAILLIGGITLVVLIALGLAAYGYYHQNISPNHNTVLKVGAKKFTYADLEHRVKAEARAGTVNTTGSDPSQPILQILQKMESEQVTIAVAKAANVTASDADIDARVRIRLNVSAEASKDEFARRLQDALLRSGYSLAEYRDLARVDVLNNNIQDHFRDAVPKQLEHVNLGLIQVQTEAGALQALARLNGGESFSAVAGDLSQDSSKVAGGDAGWLPKGALPPEVDAFTFSSNGRSGVIEAKAAFYIVEVRGKETRNLEDLNRTKIATNQTSDLIQKTREALDAKISLTPLQAQKLAAFVTKPSVG